jgi:hypothetical protein
MVPGMPPPSPRAFRFAAVDVATKFLLLFGGIWGMVGIAVTIIFSVAGGPVWNDIVLDRRGRPAQASPTAVERTSAHVNGRAIYRIAYTFTDGTGAPQASDAGTTDGYRIARATRRQPLAIDYDPAKPSRSRLAGESASLFGWFVLLPLGFAVVGAAIAMLGLRRMLRARQTYVHGQPVRAQVTAVSATLMRVNRRRVMRIDYAFDAITGRVSGRTTTSLAAPPVGASLWVLHDPAQPERNVAA